MCWRPRVLRPEHRKAAAASRPELKNCLVPKGVQLES